MTFQVEIAVFSPQTKSSLQLLLEESEQWEPLPAWDIKACVGRGLLWLWPQFLLVLVQVYLLLKGQEMVMGPVQLACGAGGSWSHLPAPCSLCPQGWDTVLCPLT